MTAKESLEVVKKLYDEVLNKNNIDFCDGIIAPNFQMHDPNCPDCKNLQGYKQLQNSYAKAFPNRKVKMNIIFASDDQVAVHWTASVTHKGEYRGISPTNKDIKVTGTSIYKIANGKISEMWQSWDRLGLLEQMGELRAIHTHH